MADALAVDAGRRGLELRLLGPVARKVEVEPPETGGQAIVDPQIDARCRYRALIGEQRDLPRRIPPAIQRPVERVAADQRARLRIALVETGAEDVVGRRQRDRVGDLDMIIIRGDREPGHLRRRHDQSQRIGIGGLDVEVRIAARRLVDLARRRCRNIPDRTRGRALRDADRGERGVADRVGALARILGKVREARGDRREELRNIRRAHRMLIDAADLVPAERLPGAAGLPRRARARVRIVRQADARFGGQAVDAGYILDDRHDQLAEDFLDVIGARKGRRRRPGAQHFVLRPEGDVGHLLGAIFAIFGAQREADRRFPGQEIAQLARNAAADDRQARAHRRSGRLVEKGDRLVRDVGAIAEKVDRHAPVRRIGTFGRAVGAQRLLHARFQSPVDIAVLAVRFAMQTIDVEIDRIGDRPADAGPDLKLIGRQVADARPGLDEAAVDDRRDLAVRGIVRTGRGARGGAVGGRDRVRRTNLRAHGIGQERVVERQLPCVAEHPRRGEAELHLRPGEHALGIDFDAVGDFILGGPEQIIALERGLEIIGGREIIGVARPDIVAQRTIGGVVDAVVDARRGRRSRTDEAAVEEIGVARNGAAALQHRLDLLIADIQHRIAAAVVEIGANRHVEAIARAVAALGDADRAGELDAGEVALGDEVCDPGDRVGAIDRRSAAGHDLGALDQRDGNDVEVGLAEQRRRYEPRPVEQHEIAVGADAAQVERSEARAAVVDRAVGARRHAGQIADQLLGIGRLAQPDFGRAHHLDGARLLEIGVLDARSGDDDRRRILDRRLAPRRVLRIGRRNAGDAPEQCRRKQIVTRSKFAQHIDTPCYYRLL